MKTSPKSLGKNADSASSEARGTARFVTLLAKAQNCLIKFRLIVNLFKALAADSSLAGLKWNLLPDCAITRQHPFCLNYYDVRLLKYSVGNQWPKLARPKKNRRNLA